MVERNPVKQKEGTDEADAEQEDVALWDSLRGKNKQEKAQVLVLKSWIWVEEILIDLSVTSILGSVCCKGRWTLVPYQHYQLCISCAAVSVQLTFTGDSISHFTPLLSHGLLAGSLSQKPASKDVEQI